MNSVEIYKSYNGETQIEVKFEKDTVWLTLNQLAALYGRDKSVISRHLKNIFKEGELEEFQTVAKNATVQKEGTKSVTREIEYYNLDAILSVGYRVNSNLPLSYHRRTSSKPSLFDHQKSSVYRWE